MNYADEAIGVARAAQGAGMPVVISFTVETDGRLPTGQTLRDAIEQTDARDRQRAGLLHAQLRAPDAFRGRAAQAARRWVTRLRGLRANASKRSHAELDAAPDLDIGDPADLGRRYRALRGALAALQRARRLLRHRSPPCRADLARLHAGCGLIARRNKNSYVFGSCYTATFTVPFASAITRSVFESNSCR